MSSEAPGYGVVPRERARGSRPGFFLAAHVALLVIVLLGFAPSFYLRPAFHNVTQLPAFLYAHGAVLTLWFSLTIVQAWLIRIGRPALHRRLGYVTAGYAAIVVLFGLFAVLRLISEINSPDDDENIVVWGSLFTLVLFAACVSLAVVFRKRPDAHRRLVLLASMSIAGPALARSRGGRCSQEARRRAGTTASPAC